MSEIEVKNKINELLVVDDISISRLNDVFNIGCTKAAKMMDYLESEGYLIEMGCYQKKLNFDYYYELKDIIFKQFSNLMKAA